MNEGKTLLSVLTAAVLIAGLSGGLNAQEESGPDKVSFGLYIIDIYNLRMQDNELAIDFYPFY